MPITWFPILFCHLCIGEEGQMDGVFFVFLFLMEWGGVENHFPCFPDLNPVHRCDTWTYVCICISDVCSARHRVHEHMPNKHVLHEAYEAYTSSRHTAVVTQLCALWVLRVSHKHSLVGALLRFTEFFLPDYSQDFRNWPWKVIFPLGKKTTLLVVESGVISSESESLHMGNEGFKPLFTNNHHVSFRPREDAFSIPCWYCGNCHYCPQSSQMT